MSKGNSLTFYGLFDIVDVIEIPILQRDYAQGRTEESEVRTLFLNSLFEALDVDENAARQTLDLDFVYGSFEGGNEKVFSVLDGQQRLTTLFLLHWYLAVENKCSQNFRDRFMTSDGRSRFTYKTRPSTTEFFNMLISKDIALLKGRVSDHIRDAQWFYLSWQQDPTVQACLNMLDAIQTRFSAKSSKFYERLINTCTPYITFQFLDLHSFGLSDELYIKMNARGKPLTIFENFKAKLEQKMKSFKAPWPIYHLPFKAGNIEAYEYFIHKIDTDWADLFWPYRNECSKDNTFDDELMNFFRLIIAYQYLLDNKKSELNLTESKNKLFGSGGDLEATELSKYEEMNCLNKDLIIRLINYLDLIYNNGLTDNKIRTYLTDFYYYSEEEIFRKVLANIAGYDDKLRFYAFYTYLSKSPSSQELNEWVRVVYNLTKNTIINTVDEFCKALFSIDELCQFETPILVTLKNNVDISSFSRAQILEEKIKAHLLLKSKEWREIIIQFEKHSFLDGQIGCILNFSGVLAFYREHEGCDWDDMRDRHYREQFSKYAQSIAAVFDLIKDSSSSINFVWERAVLSKGVYFTEKSGAKYNLLSSRDTRNNIPRDHSWRRLLRINTPLIEQKQEHVKEVFDDPNFDVKDVIGSLEKICKDALGLLDAKDWRILFLERPELFKVCEQGFIINNGNEFILLHQSQRNHTHSELYSKYLYLQLKTERFNFSPFTIFKYVPTIGTDYFTHISLEGFYEDDGLHYEIHVWYESKQYHIVFFKTGNKPYPQSLVDILVANNFTESIYDEYNDAYRYECLTSNNAKTKLIELCDALSNFKFKSEVFVQELT